MDYANIVKALFTTPWAIREDKLDEIVAFIRIKAEGGDLPEFAAAEPRLERKAGNGIAILPIFGTITKRANMVSKFSGGMSTDQFTQSFRQALNDPEVGQIVFDIDSPGGTVTGVQELADEIHAARGKKRLVAVANADAASAAYWLASQADELVVTPSGEVGSIGVIAMHEDWSKFLDTKGVKVTKISAGKFKGEGWPEFPLTDESRDYMQKRVDEYYDTFVKAVARGRGVAQRDVRQGFGEGRMVGAREAVKLGMADSIATLDEVIDSMVQGKKLGTSAADLANDIETEEAPLPVMAAGLADEDLRRRVRLAAAS